MDNKVRTKIYEPLFFNENCDGYHNCNWELSSCEGIEVFNYHSQMWCAIIDGKICLYLLNDKIRGYMGAREYIPPTIDHDGKKYNVAFLFLRCQEWNLHLPETIEDIIIDRTLSENSKYNSSHPFGNSKDSIFDVSPNNKYFYSHNGSLYSYDKKILYHYHNDYDDNVIINGIESIAPNAIFNPCCNWLSIPVGVKEIKKNAIIGGFLEIDFNGKLVNIEKGALENIKNISNENFTIKINGLVSDLTIESRNELKHWLHDKNYYRDIIFSAPKCLTKAQTTVGYIHLSGVIETNYRHYNENRLDYDKDYKDVMINAYINERIGNSSVPIVVEEALIKNLYKPVIGSRILFFAKDEDNREGVPCVEVYETKAEVELRIEQAIRKIKV